MLHTDIFILAPNLDELVFWQVGDTFLESFSIRQHIKSMTQSVNDFQNVQIRTKDPPHSNPFIWKYDAPPWPILISCLHFKSSNSVLQQNGLRHETVECSWPTFNYKLSSINWKGERLLERSFFELCVLKKRRTYLMDRYLNLIKNHIEILILKICTDVF
jgi:hypothetical protein